MAKVKPGGVDAEKKEDDHDDHFDENGKLKKRKWEDLTTKGKIKRIFDHVEHGAYCFSKYFCGFWRYVLLSVNGFFLFAGFVIFGAGMYGMIRFYGVPGIIFSVAVIISGLGFGTMILAYVGYIGAKVRNKAGSEEKGCTILTIYFVALLLVIIMEAFMFGALHGFLTGNDFLMRSAMGDDLATQTMVQMDQYMNCSYGDCCWPMIEDIILANGPAPKNVNGSVQTEYDIAAKKYKVGGSAKLTQENVYMAGNWTRAMCFRSCEKKYWYAPETIFVNYSLVSTLSPSPSSSSSLSDGPSPSSFSLNESFSSPSSSSEEVEEPLYPECHDHEKMEALCQIWDGIVKTDDYQENLNVCSDHVTFKKAAQEYINESMFIIIYGGYILGSLEMVALVATGFQLSWFCRKHKKVDLEEGDSDDEWDSDEHDDPENHHKVFEI